MRLWNNELSLETTLLFYKSTQMYGNDLNGELISKLAWSPSGLCIAASMEGTLNIYTVQRRQYFHLLLNYFIYYIIYVQMFFKKMKLVYQHILKMLG